MSFSIKTNPSSLSAQQSLGINERERQKLFAKLSSGSRITSAQDDAAGLAIAVDLASQLTSDNQAVRNGDDALSISDTADAALGQAGDILGQLRELAVASGSGALNDQQRGDLQRQASALTSELDRIAGGTEYNGTSLLSGGGSLGFQVGTGSNPATNQINITPGNVTTAALGLSNLDVSTQQNAQSALAGIDGALQVLSSTRASLGAEANRASSAIDTATARGISLAAAHSRIADADIAQQASDLTKNLILGQAGVAVLAQANQHNQAALRLLSA